MECFKCGQDDHLARDCRWTPAELDKPLPRQCTRCPRCHQVVYVWDKDIPCEDHRTVAGWRSHYHSEQFVTDIKSVMGLTRVLPCHNHGTIGACIHTA